MTYTYSLSPITPASTSVTAFRLLEFGGPLLITLAMFWILGAPFDSLSLGTDIWIFTAILCAPIVAYVVLGSHPPPENHRVYGVRVTDSLTVAMLTRLVEASPSAGPKFVVYSLEGGLGTVTVEIVPDSEFPVSKVFYRNPISRGS